MNLLLLLSALLSAITGMNGAARAVAAPAVAARMADTALVAARIRPASAARPVVPAPAAPRAIERAAFSLSPSVRVWLDRRRE